MRQLQGLYYDMAGRAFPRQVPALLKLVGPDRVLFGSDYCWTPAPLADAHIAAINAAEPTDRRHRVAHAHHSQRQTPVPAGTAR